MSARRAVECVRALLKDETRGLAAITTELAATTDQPASAIATEFRFYRWTPPVNNLRPTTAANVVVRARAWGTDQRFANLRDGRVVIDVVYEMFSADGDVIEANVAVAATALAQVLDGLRAFSDSTGGNVIDLDGAEPIQYLFGEFDTGVSAGFVASITLTERGTE